jgi:hypothetical protein
MGRIRTWIIALVIVTVTSIAWWVRWGLPSAHKANLSPQNQAHEHEGGCCPIRPKVTPSGLTLRGTPEPGGWIYMMAWTRAYHFLKERHKGASISLGEITINDRGDIFINARVNGKTTQVCLSSKGELKEIPKRSEASK